MGLLQPFYQRNIHPNFSVQTVVGVDAFGSTWAVSGTVDLTFFGQTHVSVGQFLRVILESRTRSARLASIMSVPCLSHTYVNGHTHIVYVLRRDGCRVALLAYFLCHPAST